jgi:divalent metal cation (Fe/Co/Zn/Cd) transporter
MAAFWMSLVSVGAKEIMARYTLAVGRRHNSPALLANGAMHRSDAISSTAAAAGIGLARLGRPGGFWLLPRQRPRPDPRERKFFA